MLKYLVVLTAILCSASRAFADPIFVEAESFTPEKTAPGWKAGKWGENYYASTFANTFLSRKAFLGASETAQNAVASIDIQVPEAGDYLALVRYEAAPRFETQFTLRIEQNGKVWQRLYGARDNLKIWAFGQKLQKEVSWDWGAVENIVWEGHDTTVKLEAGRARLSLIAGTQPTPGARRNVDLIMLTRDKPEIEKRIETEGYLPLDGMLTQSGDLFARITNKSAAPLTLTLPSGRDHSPYFVHLRTWKEKTIEVAPQTTSAWIEVGSLLDTLNDGQWAWTAKGEKLNYEVEFAVPGKAGAPESIRKFTGLTEDVIFAYEANMRISKRMRMQTEVLYDLIAELKTQKVTGKEPARTLIYGYTFDSHPSDAKYTAAVEEFEHLSGATALSSWPQETMSLVTPAGLRRGFLDLRGIPAPQLEEIGKKMEAEGKANDIAVISLGDEIGLPAPPPDDHVAFRAWLQEQKIPLATFGVADWNALEYSPTATATEKPALFYYSKAYAHHYGIAEIKKLTDALKKYFPNAGIGANYSPHSGAPYLGESHKWAKLFREGGMTMPWSEDYAWQIPIGSQQMSFFNIDLFRAGLKNHSDAKIQMYVMAHSPGNTPNMWRRLFYGALAHGTKVFNLYEFRPVQSAYTENYVNSPAMYHEIRRSLYELGGFEELVQDGHVAPAQVGLWHNETADIWVDNRAPYGSAKGALYAAIRHLQLPLDIVTEASDLKDCNVLYLTDRHVSRADSQAIADWVKKGGQLFATAGAGMRDELNEPNTVLSELLGVNEDKLEERSEPLRWLKQDLPFATPLDTVTWEGIALPALGAVSHVKAGDAKVIATLRDGSPAVVTKTTGQGSSTYCAFLPSLSYFKPAIPLRPVDRGSTDDSMAHFIPTQFDANAARLIGYCAKSVTPPILCSDNLVETTLIQAPQGQLIPLLNWRGAPVKNLRVTLSPPLPYRSITLGSGGKTTVSQSETATTITCDLDVADVLVLRK